MRAVLVFVLFTASTLALSQDKAAIAASQAACGPINVKFDAEPDETHHPVPEPDPAKALVFVIQDLDQEQCFNCALTKVALDGAWLGANQGSSYLFFNAEPGERHLCVNWQSRLKMRSRIFGLANFNAEAGHVYYFRVRLLGARGIFSFDLDPINSDQGKFLVASSPVSVSHVKQ
ncbi:MAG: hypothetical protein ACLPHI_07285 [Terriglobales bacterium]|jgi:hypothetical protein